MAGTLSLALISLGSGVVHAQVHLHDEGCADEAMERKTSTKKWVSSLAGVDAQEQVDSLLYINQIGDYALFWHPLLRGEEAQNILLHKQRFGDILDAAELVQCGFSDDRIREIKDHLICDAALSWQKQQWLEKAKEGRGDLFISAKSDWRRLGAGDVSGYQLQWRYTNAKTFSCGVSMQRDLGEVGLSKIIPNGNLRSDTGSRISRTALLGMLCNYHVRVSGFRCMETWIIGRYAMQLGQGLVQGGMSGFWNAPILWARRTTDWGLSEKRGWDEYQGHSGTALGFKLGNDGKNFIRGMVAVSDGRVSARVDTLGRMSSLVTDGNFGLGSNAGYQRNTEQQHGTLAILLPGGVGLAWSGYRYNRLWATREEWMRPALRAGRIFNYPEWWFSKSTAHGGLAFLHMAWQCQPNEKPKPAAVGGWIVPLNQVSDISLRAYVIHNQFRPPQGLFNQLMPNYWSVTATYSRGTTGKRSLRWAAEFRQPLLPNNDLERPLYHKQQVLWEKALSRNLLFHCLWQWNRQANLWGWDTYLGNATNNPETVPAKANTASHKITLYLKCQSTQRLFLEHQFTLVPRPQSTKSSYLYAITLQYRKPFSPLKWAVDCIAFNTETPLYFTPQTLTHEITHYTLSQRGIALNTNIQYTFKHLGNHQNKHKHKSQLYLAARTEIILKNTTENPVQPRIFVSLWLK